MLLSFCPWMHICQHAVIIGRRHTRIASGAHAVSGCQMGNRGGSGDDHQRPALPLSPPSLVTRDLLMRKGLFRCHQVTSRVWVCEAGYINKHYTHIHILVTNSLCPLLRVGWLSPHWIGDSAWLPPIIPFSDFRGLQALRASSKMLWLGLPI